MGILTESTYRELERICPGGLSRQISLAELSWWRIGGKADVIIRPSSRDELAELLRFLSQSRLRPVVIGMTTNLLFDDAGLRVPCIQISERMAGVEIDQTEVNVAAGTWVPGLARRLMQAGLAGAEHICGIPGTFGGLVFMNGGSQRQGIASNIHSVESIDQSGQIKIRLAHDCSFGYRNSIFHENDEIISSAKLTFERGTPKEIRKEMRAILAERRHKFPRKEPNCGSVFKSNPAMYDAIGPPGAIIEKLGLKGCQQGDAIVSPNHANFILNTGAASAKDVLFLIRRIWNVVYVETGYELEAEARFVAFDGIISSATDVVTT